MTAKTIMSGHKLETIATQEGVRAPGLARIADGLAAAVAVSLPWSTSATSILIVLWLFALVPTLDAAALRREIRSAAGGLPVLLWALGAIGMLWADVSWSERIAGLSGFHKLLLIPLLLAQFRRSAQANWVILGFLASSVAVARRLLGTRTHARPGVARQGLGVPVKNYILQSAIFAICAFGLIGQAAELWRTRPRLSLVLVLVAAAFIANIGYVATARTTLVVMAVLLLLFGLRQFGWKGAVGAALIGARARGAIWVSSPYLRGRVSVAVRAGADYAPTTSILRSDCGLNIGGRSLAFVAEAPVIGHGTGTIPQLFRRAATSRDDAAS